MSNYSGFYNLEVMTEAVNYNRFLLGLVKRWAPHQQLIIDFGAGIGTFAKAMVSQGFDVHCIEPDDRQRKHIEDSGLAASASIDAMTPNSVDYLYSLNVLEHIEDDQAVLINIYRSLKPGGAAFFYVPAFNLLYSSMDKKVGHYRRYTKNELMQKLHLAQFDVREIRYVDSAGFFASLLYRLIGNPKGEINPRALITYDKFIFPLSRCCDVILQYVFGKNVWAFVQKPLVPNQRVIHGQTI